MQISIEGLQGKALYSMRLPQLTKGKLLMISGKSLYSFMFNFVFVETVRIDKITKLSGVLVSFRYICQVVSYVARVFRLRHKLGNGTKEFCDRHNSRIS